MNLLMKARAYWLASLTTAVVAICMHGFSLHEASKGLHLHARAIVAPESQRGLIKAEAKQFANRSDMAAVVGLAVALASLVCLVISSKRSEPVSASVPIALLGFYVLLQFMLV